MTGACRLLPAIVLAACPAVSKKSIELIEEDIALRDEGRLTPS